MKFGTLLPLYILIFLVESAFGSIRIELDLCSSQSQSTKILHGAQGQANSFYMRLGMHGKYKPMKNIYNYKSNDKKTTWIIPGKIDSYNS